MHHAARRFFREQFEELIAAVRHEALGNVRTKDGWTQRHYWVASARAGNPDAIAALNGPPVPESLLYLYRWAHELHGRSGITQFGIAPLTYTTVRDWATVKGVSVHPHEVDALVRLDAVMSSPEAKAAPEDADAPRDTTPRIQLPWPDRKGSAPVIANG